MKNWNARLKCIWANKGKRGFQRKMRLCLLPVMAGLALFYLLPFLKVILFHFARDSFRKVCGLCQLRRSAWQSVFQAGTKEYAPYDRDMRTGLSAFIATFDDIFGEYR